MNPWKVSAQFAAFVWFLETRDTGKSKPSGEAVQFAKENWVAFLPYAHEGYGRLLIRIAKPPASASRRASRSRSSASSNPPVRSAAPAA